MQPSTKGSLTGNRCHCKKSASAIGQNQSRDLDESMLPRPVIKLLKLFLYVADSLKMAECENTSNTGWALLILH